MLVVVHGRIPKQIGNRCSIEIEIEIIAVIPLPYVIPDPRCTNKAIV